MSAQAKSSSPVVSGYVPSNVLMNVLGSKVELVTPEVAAEHAASRIIQTVKQREEKECKVDDNT